MAGLYSLAGAITETLILGSVVFLRNVGDDAAASGRGIYDIEYPDEAEATGFAPGQEATPKADVQSGGSSIEPTSVATSADDEDSAFTTMVMAAIPKGRPIPQSTRPIPIQEAKHKISLFQAAQAKIAHLAMQKALDYLGDMANARDQVASLIQFLKEADGALVATKVGVDLGSIVAKVTAAHNHILVFMQQISHSQWVKDHLSANINPGLLKLGIEAWKVFVAALGNGK